MMIIQQQKQTSLQLNPSKQSTRGLNALLFFISDVRHGIGPLFSIFLRNSLGWNSSRIGIALAIAELGSFMAQIPAGLLADALKSKRLLIVVACCIIILGCFIMRFFPFLTLIMLTQLMMGISIALITSALGAITLGLFGRTKLPVRASKNEMWNHAGNLFTAFIAGIFSYLLGNEWIFYTVMIFGMASLVSLSFIRPSEINYKIARELVENDSPTQPTAKPLPLLQLLKRKPVIIFNLSLILYYLGNGAQMTLVAQMLANKDPAHSALFIAGCMIIAEFSMIFVAYTLSKIVNQFGRKVFFLTAFFIIPIRAILYTLVDSPTLLLLIQILDGTAAGILGVIGTVINSDLAIGTGRFNFLQGIGALSISIGEATSQISAGIIAQVYNFHISFFFLGSVTFLGALFFLFLMPETKKVNLLSK